MNETELLEFEQLDQQRQQLHFREEAWLRKSGWVDTSATPACYWMWTREWQGKTLLVDQKTAARIQAVWDLEAAQSREAGNDG